MSQNFAAYGTPPPQPQAPLEQKKGSSNCLIVVIVLLAVGVPMLGVVSALAIYGFRRYLASAKTAEAKNTVGAISRGAAAAYERRVIAGKTGADRFCASSGPHAPGHGPVPVDLASVRGRKYQPLSAAGRDFQGGGPDGGWQCLKFGLTLPHYYQYHYNQGGNYQAPAGPGPDGFEAAARGDLDADGITSLFARSGSVDSRGMLRMATHLFITDEFE